MNIVKHTIIVLVFQTLGCVGVGWGLGAPWPMIGGAVGTIWACAFSWTFLLFNIQDRRR